MTIDAEDFATWRDNPVTQWVFAGCRKAAADNKDLWVKLSWDAGRTDETGLAEALIELRTRADAYEALAETTYEGWLESNGEANE